MAISWYKVSILLCISIGDTWRLHLKVFPSVPRRALRYAILAMTKTESFSVNKLVGADLVSALKTSATDAVFRDGKPIPYDCILPSAEGCFLA